MQKAVRVVTVERLDRGDYRFIRRAASRGEGTVGLLACPQKDFFVAIDSESTDTLRNLVDANVLSEPTKQTPDSRVVAWLCAQERDIAVDPVILGETAIRDSHPSQGTEADCSGGLV